MDDYVQILVTIIGVLGSASIWKFLEARMKMKSQERNEATKNDDGMQYRDDLKNRVCNLEAMLARSSDEKDELRDKVLLLTGEVEALKVKVEFLSKENDRLKNK
jgi:predicted nuclease with TOPRIM domain